MQVATVVSNHLATGLMKYFGDAARYGPLINLFEKLVVKEGEVACLLAQSYLGMSASSAALESRISQLTCSHLHALVRRGGQGRPRPAVGDPAASAVVLAPARPVRLFALKGEDRVGA